MILHGTYQVILKNYTANVVQLSNIYLVCDFVSVFVFRPKVTWYSVDVVIGQN